MSMPEADAQLPLKKRARRRLVGAIALAVLAAVVLPMVMDQTPQLPVQDVQIRIPGQDQVPAFSPKALASKPAEAPVAKAAAPVAEQPISSGVEKTAEKSAEKSPAESAKTATKVEKKSEKPAEKSAEKMAEKAPEKPVAAKAGADDSNRAAAILSGKPAADASAAAKSAVGGEHVILIGAFANPANVKQLQGKLGELNIKVFTETLDSPQGKKTRVRAGPFASREAAEKALDRMKRIGVNGVVAAKQ